ncbi:MAG: SRPBCC domain-containing protein [Acidobacteria bacterium]|nr:SRPBCC domain-containing protein [Acidobacteriota bacterium]
MVEAIRQGDIPGVQLRCRRALTAGAATAWDYLVEPRHLEDWLCRQARLTAAVASDFEWRGSAELGEDSIEQGTILAIEPPHLLVATLRQPAWVAATRLEIEIVADGQACEISVLQRGFEHLPLSQGLTVWETYRRRWSAALERLARLDRTAPP